MPRTSAFEWILGALAGVVCFCAATPVRFSPKDARCIYNNETYSGGDKFRPEPCMFCKCPRRGGRVECAVQDCQFSGTCVRYERRDGECCGRCVQHGCKHTDDRIYLPGAVISASQCERCVCPDSGGRVTCRKVVCAALRCVDPVHDEGHCCPRCPNGENCWLNGKVLKAGDIVLEQECRVCSCYHGPHPAWLGGPSEQPRAVCFVLTSKEKEGCPNEAMVADQPPEGAAGDAAPYLLRNNHAQRHALFRSFLERHGKRQDAGRN